MSRKRKTVPEGGSEEVEEELTATTGRDDALEYARALRLICDARVYYLNAEKGSATHSKSIGWTPMVQWMIKTVLFPDSTGAPENASDDGEERNTERYRVCKRLFLFMLYGMHSWDSKNTGGGGGSSSSKRSRLIDLPANVELTADHGDYVQRRLGHFRLLSKTHKYASYIVPFDYRKREENLDLRLYQLYDAINGEMRKREGTIRCGSRRSALRSFCVNGYSILLRTILVPIEYC